VIALIRGQKAGRVESLVVYTPKRAAKQIEKVLAAPSPPPAAKPMIRSRFDVDGSS